MRLRRAFSRKRYAPYEGVAETLQTQILKSFKKSFEGRSQCDDLRRKLLVIGVVLVLVGVILFFGGPVFFEPSIHVSQLIPLKHTSTLNAGQNVTVGTVPPGRLGMIVYNDSLNKALRINATTGSMAFQESNGTFAVELYNTGSFNASVFAFNNSTLPLTVNYSSLVTSVSGLYYAAFSVLAGLVLAVAGFGVSLAGAILKPKPANPPAEPTPIPGRRSKTQDFFVKMTSPSRRTAQPQPR